MATKLKIVLGALTLGLILSGCRKTKLKDEYAIFEGKWKWVGAIESKKPKVGGSATYSYRNASEFQDEYWINFEHKGKLQFIKNDDIDCRYRTVFSIFNNNCNSFNDCDHFNISLNNKDDKQFVGFVNTDSLSVQCHYTNLPLQNGIQGDYEYLYEYFYVKIH